MKLQTKVNITPPKSKISHESSLLFVGSCFTENIGKQLQTYKFPTLVNPCGIAYNPVSVANSLAFCTGKKTLSENDFIFCNGKWHSLHHHGRFSNANRKTLQENVNNEVRLAQQKLSSFSHIFLTLGTSWVFEHIATRQIVNNCHKIPAKEFIRKRLSVAAIVKTLQNTISQIRKQNTTAEIIFTVSPVRHLKDGLHENQVSKATLLLAIEELQKKDETIGYFPAYEIAMDELRDYRFFSEDFCHLNTLGIQYVWERFSETYICEKSQQHFPALQKLQKALAHKVQDENSNDFQQFKQKIAMQIASLEKKFPNVNFSKEKKFCNE